MTKRRCLLWGVGLILAGLFLVLLIPRCRYALVGIFMGHPQPPASQRGRPNGWGGLSSAPLDGEDSDGKGRLLPGIDYCSYAAGNGLNGFVYFVWGDFSGGAGGTNSESRDGLKFHGYLWNGADKRRVEFAGETKDGRAGGVTIDGKDYDLAQGTLFLVSARRGYRVKQLTRDMTGFQDNRELFNAFRKSDPDVVEFFARAVATSLDGRWTAIAKDQVFSVIENETGRVERQCDGHKEMVTSLAFSPDGKALASGGKDKLVILWAIPSGEILHRFDVPSPVYNVEFSGGGKTLTVREAASPTDTTLRVFDLASRKQVDVGWRTVTP